MLCACLKSYLVCYHNNYNTVFSRDLQKFERQTKGSSKPQTCQIYTFLNRLSLIFCVTI